MRADDPCHREVAWGTKNGGKGQQVKHGVQLSAVLLLVSGACGRWILLSFHPELLFCLVNKTFIETCHIRSDRTGICTDIFFFPLWNLVGTKCHWEIWPPQTVNSCLSKWMWGTEQEPAPLSRQHISMECGMKATGVHLTPLPHHVFFSLFLTTEPVSIPWSWSNRIKN